ncbi:MAG: PEP-CTERM system TPR-repeat protein PrsT, partial [Gammaproteobacteria bacterium]|nr:PEP-CTERM system TPR-repeat protein PrsT [Gammaproteobacteria bacterium]
MQYKMKTLASAKYLILLASTLMLLACGPELTDQQMLETAKTYLDQNKLREAALELKNVLQENPDTAEARYLLGMINLDAGDVPAAEKEFRRAADAGWPESLSRIGQARAMINSMSFQAIIDEIDIKDDFPAHDRADLLALRALSHANLGNIDQAMATLADAIEIDADAFHVLKTAIQIHLAHKDMEQASNSLKKAQSQYSDNPEMLLLSAAMSIRNKDSSAASEAYKKIIARDPEKLVTVYGRQARLGLARLEILNAELDKAQLTLSPLIKSNVSDPEVNFVSGLLAFEQGQLEPAAERLLAVLKVAPDHALTQLLFGTVNYAQQNYEQAAYYISKYISVIPENINARKLLGRAYLKLGQHDEAQAALQAGMESNAANDAELMALVGFSQLQAGDTASGIACLERAVKAAPESLMLKSELARAYISAGETESAIRELNSILADSGDTKQAEALLISAHIRSRHYDKAIDAVLSMLQKFPDDAAVLSLAGNVFAVSNNRAEAREYFNKALQIKPDNVPATMLLARLEIIDGHPARAEALYKKLAETNTADIAPLMALAHLAESQNQTSKMLEWLEKARTADAGNVKPTKVLAEHYLKEGQLDKAAPLLSEALKIAPRDNTLLFLQAKLQIAEGYHNKALSTLNELVSRSPDSLLARTMLAEMYLKLNQPADTHRHLERVLENQPYYVPALLLMAQLELQSGDPGNALSSAIYFQMIKPVLYLGYELAGDASM